MKGFFTWFKNSTKLKRWMLLVLAGIILSCYGISEILVFKTLDFIDIARIIAVFVVGFTCIIIALIYMQKRTLEILIQDNNLNKTEAGVKSLIFDKNVYDNGPKIVAIGGGTGLESVLAGIKKYTNNITAIATVSDYGAKPTSSRAQLGLPPLEDIKGSIAALAPSEDHMDKLFNHKFANDRLKDLTFGDIYMYAMRDITGSIVESIKESKKVLNITGKILPVTLDEMKICAELKDGTIIEEKDKIAEVAYEKISQINRMYITPSNVRPADGVLEAIKEADSIIIGPGSLYTNIIPNLLVKNVAKAIKESKAKKIYISNIMTEPGQTDNYSLSEHIKAIVEHSGKGIIEYCICDTGEIVPEYVRRYNQKGSDLVEQDISKISSDIKVIQKDLSCIKEELIRHNSEVVAGMVMEIIFDDLKFKDKRTDKQYVLLNTKLKDHRKSEKYRNSEKKKNKAIEEKQKAKRLKGSNSKFAEKYSERIESIQNSEKTRKKNLEKQTEKIEKPMEKIEKSAGKVEEQKVKSHSKTDRKKEVVEKPKKEVKKAVKKKPAGKRMNNGRRAK